MADSEKTSRRTEHEALLSSSLDKLDRAQLRFLARTSNELQMDSEAFEYVKCLMEIAEKLNEEERNLFMKTAKAKINFLRNGYKNLLDFQNPDDIMSIPELLENKIAEELMKIESTIRQFCMNLVATVQRLESALDENDQMAKIFYKKFKADYMRYYAEVSNDDFDKFVSQAEEHYNEAYDLCSTNNLEMCNPLMLSVALNFSVFIYYMLDDTLRAFNLAENVYKQAIFMLTNEKKAPEVDELIKSIEDNLTIWKTELHEIN